MSLSKPLIAIALVILLASLAVGASKPQKVENFCLQGFCWGESPEQTIDKLNQRGIKSEHTENVIDFTWELGGIKFDAFFVYFNNKLFKIANYYTKNMHRREYLDKLIEINQLLSERYGPAKATNGPEMHMKSKDPSLDIVYEHKTLWISRDVGETSIFLQAKKGTYIPIDIILEYAHIPMSTEHSDALKKKRAKDF